MHEQDRVRGTMDQLLNVREVSQLLRLHPKTVYALVERGSIPHVRLGRRVLFSLVDVTRWVEARREGV